MMRYLLQIIAAACLLQAPFAPRALHAQAPQNISWTGAGDGAAWSDPANWSTESVPTPADTATLAQIDASSYTVQVTTARTVGGLVLASDAATLNVGDSLHVTGGFTFERGAVAGSSGLTVAGSFAWSGGSMSGTGATVLDGGATLSGMQPLAVSARTLTFNATATFSMQNAEFGNEPTLDVRDSATVVVGETGVIDFTQPSTGIYPASGTSRLPTLVNNGIIKRTVPDDGIETIRIGYEDQSFGGDQRVILKNNGTIQSETGIVNVYFAEGSQAGGTFTAEREGTLRLQQDGVNTAPQEITGTVSGGGRITVYDDFVMSGTWDVTGVTNISSSVCDVTFDAAADLQSFGNLNISGYDCSVDIQPAGSITANTLRISNSNSREPISLTLMPDLTVTNVFSMNGSVDGPGSISVQGVMSWEAGSYLGGGSLEVEQLVALPGTGGDFPRYAPSRALDGDLVVRGTARWDEGTLSFRDGASLSIQPNALFLMPFDGRFAGNGTVINDGEFKKTATGKRFINKETFEPDTMRTAAGTVFGVPFTNKGTLSLEAGRVTVQEGAALTNSGTVQGTDTLDVTGANTQFSNAGILGPGTSPGIFKLDGDYSNRNGTLEVELAGTEPGSEYDQLSVSGSVTLGGELDVHLTDDFVPASGDTFTVVTASSVAQAFDTANLPSLLEVSYEPDRVLLVAAENRPPPPIEEDSLALVALYNSTGGDGWDDNAGWLEAPVSEWFGVTVEEGRVTRLDLAYNGLGAAGKRSVPPSERAVGLYRQQAAFGRRTAGSSPQAPQRRAGGNGLTGTLPPELGHLSRLQDLYLRGNQLSGQIPSELGQLSNLHVLNLALNQLSGSIPPELEQLASLEVLSLDGNKLTGEIPPALGQLSNLKVLQLFGNQLTGTIPSVLGQLSNLRILGLGRNGLSGDIPQALTALAGLQVLNVGGTDNQLDVSGFLPELPNFEDLRALYVYESNLSEAFPSEVLALDSLRTISIFSNQLSGPLPGGITELERLQQLYVHQNRLTDLPADLSLPDLRFFSAQANRLTFEDLEPNVRAARDTFIYAPQDTTLGIPRAETVAAGARLSLGFDVAGASNLYQWYKDGEPVAGATADTLKVASVTPEDAGEYVLEVTNTVAVALTLRSNAITVVVDDEQAEVESEDVALAGSRHRVTATVPDGFDLTESTLHFRQTGARDYRRVSFVQTDGALEATVPSDAITIRGVEYYATFSNGRRTLTVPAENPVEHPVRRRVFQRQLSYGGPALPSGTYRMVSVPGVLSLPQGNAVLSDDFGPQGTDSWRLLRWNAEAEAYDENPSEDALTPGLGFWLITAEGGGFDVDSVASVGAASPTPIRLKPGWNQIGNPFAFPVAWRDVLGTERVEAPVRYVGGDDPWRYNQQQIRPWEGYFVFNRTGEPLTLRVPPVEASTADSTVGKRASTERWAGPVEAASYVVQLRASSANSSLVDYQNYLGFSEAAAPGLDASDFSEAPGVGDHLRLSVVGQKGRLAGSFKPPGREGQFWDLELALRRQGVAPRKVTDVAVTLRETGEHPRGYKLFVLDRDSERSLPVEANTFHATVGGATPVRRLRLIVGTPAFAEQSNEGISLTPVENALEPGYPNPFRSQTTIPFQLREEADVTLDVYDVLGQRVLSLVNAKREAGFHRVRWDGRDASGRRLASGIYFYRFRAGSFSATRRVVLVH